MKLVIDKTITIEDLVREYPESVTFLMEKGIKCLVCGEPIWGTLESSAREKGYDETQIDGLLTELKEYLARREEAKGDEGTG